MRPKAEWRDVNTLLCEKVPAGSVTTYAGLSQHLYRRMLINPVTSLLKACAANAAVDYSHRVVMEDGGLSPKRSGGPDRQRKQLEAEGVVFTPDGKVDFGTTPRIECE